MVEVSNQNTVSWQSPSNIALVKYWGKRPVQLPQNASISFTLNNCHSKTTLKWKTKKEANSSIEVYLEDVLTPSFAPKIQKFLNFVSEEYPVLNDYDFTIHTSNTFPHSSGIASSASGMSALALCICSMLKELNFSFDFYPTASRFARLGSGSASRSVYGGLVVWGSHIDYEGSNDETAVPFEGYHYVFNTFNDTILIVHEGQKTVSSTVGHQLLNNHPFEQIRYSEAQKNMGKMKEILIEGDLDKFVDLIEKEALMLHAMMLTSDPSFILMKPETLAIIEKIREDRKQNGGHIAFTLDAGANVHMLFPEKDRIQAEKLIENQLVEYCSNGKYICDKVGNGPALIKC
jgi:diphosphomevalonate decarboxylase